MAKILIVDDDVTITELMKALIKMEGHEPTTVNNSLQAIDVANAVNPDLITLDLMMPGLSGYELCALLREDPKFADTPIIIISAKGDPASIEKAISAGANDYITKPFGVDNFLTKINTLISV